MSYTEIKEILNKKYPVSDWVVDGLLRTGRRRPSLLLGKPEAGKSTLARQLAAAVIKGEPFLGRTTKKGAVLYWQSEEEDADLQQAFKSFGISKEAAPLYVFTGNPDDSGTADLAAELAKRPEVTLVIIETLDDLLRLNDVKENSGARLAFDAFNNVIMEPFAKQAAVIALWHLKKAATDFAGDALLGATVIRGRTDGKIFLQQYSQDDDRRVIFSSKRIGRSIPKTFLDFDPITGKSTLGQTLEEADDVRHTAKTDGETRTVVAYVTANPGCNMRDAMSALSGKQGNRLAAVHQMLRDGLLVNRGTDNAFKLHVPVTLEAETPVADAGRNEVQSETPRAANAPCAPKPAPRGRGPITVAVQ